MDLATIVKQVEQESTKVYEDLQNLTKDFNFSKCPAAKQWLAEDSYVKNLGGLCRVLGIHITDELNVGKKVCEIGTMYGNSTLGLALGCSNLESFDIDVSNFLYQDLVNLERVILTKVDPDFCYTVDYSPYSFVYIDIGVHDGLIERKVHKRLQETYKGLVAYDDINWGGMVSFWNEIKEEKIETTWHRSSGFGVVKYV